MTGNRALHLTGLVILVVTALGLSLTFNRTAAGAVANLQLPWPSGVLHNISGGATYDCYLHTRMVADNPPRNDNANYYAVDFGLNYETVTASAPGIVSFVGADSGDGYGNKVEIDHSGGYLTMYAHLDHWSVNAGDQVSQGQVIGQSGQTGGNYDPHLHFQMQYGLSAFVPEPMSGVTDFGHWGYCTSYPNSTSWTSAPPACTAPSPPYDTFSTYKEQDSPDLWVDLVGTLYQFHSVAAYTSMGYSWVNLQCVPDGWLASHIPSAPPDKTSVKEFGNDRPTIYLVDCSVALPFPSWDVYQAMIAVGYVVLPLIDGIPPGDAGRLQSNQPVNGCEMRELTDPSVYVVCANPMKKWYEDAYAFTRFGPNVRWLWDGALSGMSLIPQALLSDSCPDSDRDVWSDPSELFMGTDENRACAATSTRNDEPLRDAWPADFDDSQSVNGNDTLTFAPVFGGIAPNPPYNPRWDLNSDGKINGNDLLKLGPFFGKTCA